MLLVLPAMALLTPLIEVFGTLSIPLFAVESLLFVGAVAGAGLIVGAVLAWLAPGAHDSRWRDLAFVGLLTAAAIVVVDVSAGGHRIATALSDDWTTRLGLLAGMSLGLLLLFWLLRRHIAPILFVAVTVFFVSTLALNTSIFVRPGAPAPIPQTTGPVTDAPPLVYVILDGAMGIEGLATAPGGSELASSLRRTFEERGFRVYGRAFSRHFVSARSIPNTLNFDFHDNTWGSNLRYSEDLRVTSKLFEQRRRSGYDVVSYRTEHIDLCFPGVSRCETMPSFNPFSPYIPRSRSRAVGLFRVLRHASIQSYVVYRTTGLLSALFEDGPPPAFVGFDAAGFPGWLDRFEADLAASPRGRAYFAHILMPHAPYVLDAHCRDTGRSTVGYFLTEERQLTGAALDAERTARYGDYTAQYGCVQGQIAELLDGIERLPQFRDATIVIHGDHGPRISKGQYAPGLSNRDMVDNYSSLYAVKAPGVEPGYDRRQTSIQRLTAEYLGGGSAAALGPDELTVAIDVDTAGNVAVAPMPLIGPAYDEQLVPPPAP